MSQAEQDFARHLVEHPEALGDPAQVIGEVEAFIRRHVILPPGLTLVQSLWAAGTHIFDVFDTFPYLAITSPAPRCGKTRATELLELFCREPLRASNLSEAVLFRLIESRQPTLIVDEAEALRNRKSERSQALIGLFNAGHRKGALAYRCVGQKYEVQGFVVFCPKVLVSIGGLPDTLRDRSIVIQMQRHGPGERVGRFLFQRAQADAAPLREKLEATVLSHQQAIAEVYGQLDLIELEDREAENWSPLLSVCAVLAPALLAELKATALANAQGKAGVDADESLRIRLLADLRAILAEQQHALFPTKEGMVATATLLEGLRSLEESPWAEQDLNAHRLAKLLRPFGVCSRKFREGDRTRRGFAVADLEAVFARYLGH